MTIRPTLASPHDARSMPVSLESEQALLGCILSNNRAIDRAAELCEPHYFVEPLHGRLWASCVLMSGRGQLVDPIIAAGVLEGDPDLKRLGGLGYLNRLVGTATTIINVADYARLIRDLHIRRELIALGEDIVNAAFQPEDGQSAAELVIDAEAGLLEIGNAQDKDGGLRGPAHYLREVMDDAEKAARSGGKTAGLTTGFPQLDGVLGGLAKSALILLAARPGQGKSSLAGSIARNVGERLLAEGVGKVFIFSAESSGKEFFQRLVGEHARVSVMDQRRGTLNSDDFGKMDDAVEHFRPLPIWLDDAPGRTPQAIYRAVRRLAKPGDPCLVIIDYLQLLAPPANMRRSASREEQVGAISRGLKGVAKMLNMPVLALAQLSRDLEKREEKRPGLSDLRESGSLEMDADVVAFIHREHYYLLKSEPKKKPTESYEAYDVRRNDWHDACERAEGKAEVIVGKNRHGGTGTAMLDWNGRLMSFTNPVVEDDALNQGNFQL